jgi:hypothetical protein
VAKLVVFWDSNNGRQEVEMAGEIFTTAGLAMILTLVGLAVGYGILKVTNANE